ncbi:MAG TPA: TonB-dependent receptor plug domain-containing protein, partial [Opitutaceae bacterium]|nr:TonB-dependent receptor plug domain-containing protein [Opitutaceae bacterium]
MGSTQLKSVAALTALLVAQGTAAMAAPSDAADDAADGSQPTKLDRVLIEESKGKALVSPKFTEPLRDTPQTVVVVPQIIMEQQGATNLSDVLRNTPGITFLAGEGGGASGTAGDAFYLRGFDASNSIFVDGVRDTGAYSRDVFNLEQVEIAKGPAGADNGRGATSGYVNLASKTPRLTEFNRATLSYGSGEHKRVTADINAPLKDSPINGTAFRLNLLYQDGGVAGRDWAEQNRWGVSPSLALGLGTPTQVTLSYQYVDQDNLPDYGMPSAALPGLLQTTPPTGSVSQKNFYGLVNADFEDVSNEVGTVHVQHQFNPDVRLTNQTRYSKTDRF